MGRIIRIEVYCDPVTPCCRLRTSHCVWSVQGSSGHSHASNHCDRMATRSSAAVQLMSGDGERQSVEAGRISKLSIKSDQTQERRSRTYEEFYASIVVFRLARSRLAGATRLSIAPWFLNEENHTDITEGIPMGLPRPYCAAHPEETAY
jgi:hypothetical protein